MNRLFSLVVAVLAFVLMAALIAAYLWVFGVSPSHDRSVWGAFGDYFGGILNPVFALFAFLGVLWSLGLQMKQVNQLALDKQADEILQVVKDIDNRVSELLRTAVAEAAGSDVLILHMAAEAERIQGGDIDGGSNFLDAEDIYIRFLEETKSSGSVSGIAVREIGRQVASMYNFLKRYPTRSGSDYAAIVDYYATKTSRITPLLIDAKVFPPDVRNFFRM